MRTGALAHLRVVDLTDLRGALAGRMLADLGADVIKIEPPSGDPDRLTPPFAGGVAAPDRSLPFLFRNLGKRSAVIDLPRAGSDSTPCSPAPTCCWRISTSPTPSASVSPPRRSERDIHTWCTSASPTSDATGRAPAGGSSRCPPSPRQARSGRPASRIGRHAGCRASRPTTARRSPA